MDHDALTEKDCPPGRLLQQGFLPGVTGRATHVVDDDGRSGAQWGHTGQMWRHQMSRTLIRFASERLRSEKAKPLDRALVDQ